LNTFITVIHVSVCVVLILVILLQAGKGGGMGAALGGGSQSVFGGRGAQTFLGKVTSVCAAIFMVTSVTLAVMSSRRTGSVIRAGSLPPPPAETVQVPLPGQAPAGGPVSQPPAPTPAPAPQK